MIVVPGDLRVSCVERYSSSSAITPMIPRQIKYTIFSVCSFPSWSLPKILTSEIASHSASKQLEILKDSL